MLNQVLVRSMVDGRSRAQKERIGCSNKLSAVERGSDSMEVGEKKILEKHCEMWRDIEDEMTHDIEDLVKGDEIIERMTHVKGIGLTLAAKVVCMIDINRCDTVSALWRYCGYGVINGERERPTKGEKLHYNKTLKSTLYLVAGSFLKSNSPYRAFYDSAREYYEANHPDWTKLHQHNAALRKMTKAFLAHLWMVWRMVEGLPIRDLYVNEKLAHEHYYTPEEFGWEIKPVQ